MPAIPPSNQWLKVSNGSVSYRFEKGAPPNPQRESILKTIESSDRIGQESRSSQALGLSPSPGGDVVMCIEDAFEVLIKILDCP